MLKRQLNAGGIKTFTFIWLGQLVSMVGTAMTRFALLTWAYQQTGDATTVALLGFFSFVPYVLLSPIAGVWVDRLDRRLVMLCADLGAGLTTIILLLLYVSGNLQIWHIYLLEALSGAFESFQIPAYSAAITTLVPKSQYARASGMRSLAQSASQVLAPFMAGLLLALIDINGVMLIDVITFLFAVSTLLIVRFPQPIPTISSKNNRASVRAEIRFGFRYIFQRRGLMGLMFIFTGINLFAALTYFSILPAMILARSGGDKLALATVQGALGLAGVLGGVVISVWGLPKRRIHAALGITAISFLLGDFSFAIGQSLPMWIFAAFASAFFIPFIVAGDRIIWQVKVAPEVQGRVFAIQSMLRTAMMPVGYLMGGLLADHLFEPAMRAGGVLSGVFGPLVGIGPGAGMGLMFLCTCVFGALISASGYLFRSVRNVEDELPDHDAVLEAGAISVITPAGAD